MTLYPTVFRPINRMGLVQTSPIWYCVSYRKNLQRPNLMETNLISSAPATSDQIAFPWTRSALNATIRRAPFAIWSYLKFKIEEI